MEQEFGNGLSVVQIPDTHSARIKELSQCKIWKSALGEKKKHQLNSWVQVKNVKPKIGLFSTENYRWICTPALPLDPTHTPGSCHQATPRQL